MSTPSTAQQGDGLAGNASAPRSGAMASPLMAASAGVVVGIDLLSRSAAFALLAFAGPLAAGADPAMVLFLGTSILASFLGLMLAPSVSVFGAVQSAPLVILLPALMTAGADTASAFAILGGTAIATGAAMALMATFNLGRFVRLMPYPVTAGFLAAAGALMVMAALRMIVPDLSSAILSPLSTISPEQAVNLGLALGFAVAMKLASHRWPDFGAVAVLALGIMTFFLALEVLSIGIPGARSAGLLPAAASHIASTIPIPSFWIQADPALIWASLPLMAAAVFISILGHLLNITGIELGLRTELRSRLWLCGTSGVNLLTGAAGSSVSFASSTSTLVAEHLGGRSRISGVVACGVLVAGLLGRQDILPLAPRFVPSGLLLFVGYEILSKWFFRERQKQTVEDWVIMGGLIVATLAFGMLTAIGIGIVLSCLIFAVNYARIDTIRSIADLSGRRSTVDRGPSETAALDHAREEVAILRLQGYLFFGSVDQLVKSIRALLDREPPVRTIILDCAEVTGLDAAAVATMHKLEYLAEAHGGTIVIAGLREELSFALSRQGMASDPQGALRVTSNADAALQNAEARLIERSGVTDADDDARVALIAGGGDAAAADRLLARMQRQELAAGSTLIDFGAEATDIFVVDRGRVAVLGRNRDGRRFRMRSFRQGAIVGEIAFYLEIPRTADVIAEEDSVVYRLTPEILADLEHTDPAALATWHRIAAHTLAEKLRRTNDMLREATN